MIQQIKPALIMFALLAIVTGVLYPLGITAAAQLAFPGKSNGSIIYAQDVPVGSILIGQDFSDPRYFQGRPSATSGHPYLAFDPHTLTGSSGSNLGPLSLALVEAVERRVEYLRATNPDTRLPIPVDLVAASASGLDPEISVEAAMYQVPRLAHLRGISEDGLNLLIRQHTTGRLFGLLGEPRVNVLLLNLALDEIK